MVQPGCAVCNSVTDGSWIAAAVAADGRILRCIADAGSYCYVACRVELLQACKKFGNLKEFAAPPVEGFVNPWPSGKNIR